MATTATSASSSTSTATADAQAAAAAKRASAQKIITSLSAGSGVDVAALAQGLVEARKNRGFYVREMALTRVDIAQAAINKIADGG